eukprot:TRINITY_DN5481_c0_g1_i1.p1 TRINITY_DN5481_c0_g1~~TRINITY_DN5481_c0_g1_i1.p1  ORF type:complete len:827 (+),score=62.08 TRINITY_DN5481_c0_g1_i1:61-2481(+)
MESEGDWAWITGPEGCPVYYSDPGWAESMPQEDVLSRSLCPIGAVDLDFQKETSQKNCDSELCCERGSGGLDITCVGGSLLGTRFFSGGVAEGHSGFGGTYPDANSPGADWLKMGSNVAAELWNDGRFEYNADAFLCEWGGVGSLCVNEDSLVTSVSVYFYSSSTSSTTSSTSTSTTSSPSTSTTSTSTSTTSTSTSTTSTSTGTTSTSSASSSSIFSTSSTSTLDTTTTSSTTSTSTLDTTTTSSTSSTSTLDTTTTSSTSSTSTLDTTTTSSTSSTSTLDTTTTSSTTSTVGTTTTTSANSTSNLTAIERGRESDDACFVVAVLLASVAAVVAAPTAGLFVVVNSTWAPGSGGGDVPLPTLLSPLQLSVDGSPALGAVLGNLALALGVAVAAHVILAVMHGALPGTAQWLEGCGMTGFVSCGLLVFQLLYMGVVRSAVALLSDGRTYEGAAAVVLCFAYAAFVTAKVLQGTPLLMHRVDIRTTSKAATFLVGSGELVSMSRRNDWAARWGVLVRSYREGSTSFAIVELAACTAVAVAAGATPATASGVGHVRVIVGVVLTLYLCGELFARPFADPYRAVCSALLVLLLAVASFVGAAAAYAGMPGKVVPVWMVWVCITVLILWSMCAASAAAWRICSRRQQRMQLEAFAETEWREDVARDNLTELFATAAMNENGTPLTGSSGERDNFTATFSSPAGILEDVEGDAVSAGSSPTGVTSPSCLVSLLSSTRQLGGHPLRPSDAARRRPPTLSRLAVDPCHSLVIGTTYLSMQRSPAPGTPTTSGEGSSAVTPQSRPKANPRMAML